MAGKAATVQSFSDAWQRASEKVMEVRGQLATAVARDTGTWFGGAADAYRARAQEITFALEAAAQVAAATGEVTRQMGEVIANARQQVRDLLTDLVGRLVPYVQQATATEGGVTPTVVARAHSMIDSCRAPIAAIEQRLEQALADVQPPTSSIPAGNTIDGKAIVDVAATVAGALGPGRVVRTIAGLWRGLRSILGRRGTAPSPGSAPPPAKPSQEVTEAQMIRAIRESPTTKIGEVSPPSTVPAGQNVGNVMHDRVEQVVRQNWPGVRFGRTPLGAGGPDMPVTGRSSGSPDPGFDWVEIKPNSDTGIEAFVRREWGTTPAWSGRGRLVTYDSLGNVSEIDFPATTHP
jgi:hypothetical protein